MANLNKLVNDLQNKRPIEHLLIKTDIKVSKILIFSLLGGFIIFMLGVAL